MRIAATGIKPNINGLIKQKWCKMLPLMTDLVKKIIE
jgi:hypothetical protein